MSVAVFTVMSIFILTAGTLFVMWLGEKITDKGIGMAFRSSSMVGIIAQLPSAFLSEGSAFRTGE